MENKKNELGNIYGSRISKNGKWLNLIIVTRHGSETIYITCPVRMALEGVNEKKPFAFLEGKNVATIAEIPLYEDRKEEQQDEQQDETPTSDELPF